jgi:hypothetical protein
VVGRTPDGARTLGKIDTTDADALATLLSLDAHPIGLPGAVSVADDGLQRWRFA